MGFQCLVLSLYHPASALDRFIYAFLVAFISTMYFFSDWNSDFPSLQARILLVRSYYFFFILIGMAFKLEQTLPKLPELHDREL